MLKPKLKSADAPQDACLILSAVTDWLHFLAVCSKTCVLVHIFISLNNVQCFPPVCEWECVCACACVCMCVIAEDRRELKEVLTLEIIEELEGAVRVTGTAIL